MRVVLMPPPSSSSSSVLPPRRTVPEEADLHFKSTLEDHAVPPADHTTGRPSYGWVPPLHVPRLCPSISAEPPQQESAAFYFLKNTPREASRSLPLRRNRQNKNYSHKIICQWRGSYYPTPLPPRADRDIFQNISFKLL